MSLAVYGHPTLFVYPTTLIRKAAPYLGIDVEIVAGISTLDTMLIDLDLDPGMNGLQLYDANAVLVERRSSGSISQSSSMRRTVADRCFNPVPAMSQT